MTLREPDWLVELMEVRRAVVCYVYYTNMLTSRQLDIQPINMSDYLVEILAAIDPCLRCLLRHGLDHPAKMSLICDSCTLYWRCWMTSDTIALLSPLLE